MDPRLRGLPFVFVAGCAVGDLDLSGKECPCSSGYVCDSPRNVCVLKENIGAEGGPGFEAGPGGETGPGGDAGADGRDGTVSDATPDSGPPPSCDGGLSGDPHNCGACGHDCLGGQCLGGVCQPVLLAAGANSYTGLAIGSGNVYWTVSMSASSAEVLRCSTSGCNGQPTVVAMAAAPTTPAVDNSNVYWSDNSTGQVLQCPLVACNGSPLVLSSGQPHPAQVAVDATSVYWTTGDITMMGTVQKCAIGGCNGSPTQLASGDSIPHAIAVDGTTAYWIAGYPIPTNQIHACPVAGGAVNVFVTTMTAVEVALTAPDVYWADTTDVLRCAKTGCGGSPTSIATIPNGNGTGVFALDGQGLYFVSGTQIFGCPLAGCSSAPKLVATSPSTVLGIATDATAVYWLASDSSAGTSQLLKLAK